MSIAERIASMSNNLSSAYDGIEYLGVDTTGVDKNLQNLSSMLNVVYEGLPKVSDEGISPSIEGSRVGRLNTTLKASDTTQDNTILPSEYTQVDYIESSGTQYIDTGYKAKNTTRVIGKFDILGYDAFLFGARQSTNSTDQFVLNLGGAGNRYNYRVGNLSAIAIATSSVMGILELDMSCNKYTIKNEIDTYNGTITGVNDFSSNYNFYLMALNLNNTAASHSTAKLYNFKILENDTLVRNFVPCYRNSDNEVGLFDIVNNVFYTNQGTGTFTYGAVVSIPNPDYPQDIHVVKGNNTVEVCGKNRFNKTTAIDGKRLGSDGQPYSENNYCLSDFINVLPSTSYTYSRATSGGGAACYCLYDNEKKFISRSWWGNNTTDLSLTLTTSNNARYIRITDLQTLKDNMQLEKGSTATTYEPYNGTTYPINLPVQNLLPTDENAWEQGGISSTTGEGTTNTARIRTIDYYPIKNDIDYYISVQDTTYRFVNIFLYDGTKNYIGQYYTINSSISGAASLKINIPSSAAPNVKYMRVVLRKAAGTTSDTILPNEVSIIKPMIELGDKPNRYTPYGVAPIELCKKEDYQDKLFKAIVGDTVYDSLTAEQKEGLVSGGWYKYEEMPKVVFNGSENWWYDGHQTTPAPRTVIQLYNIGYKTTQYISSHFVQGSDTPNKIVSSTANLYMSLADSITGVLADDTNQEKRRKMTDWLNAHNVDFYYVLETPTITQITDTTLISQLNALYNAMSYNGQTNILQTNADLPFIISASALKGE